MKKPNLIVTHSEKRTWARFSDFIVDADNRLSTQTDNRIGGTTTYHYDADGNLQTLAYPNNVTTTYHYDTLDRLTGTAAVKGNSPLATYAYTLRADGLRTSLAESGPATSGRTDTWTMDTLNRLTTESITNASSGVNGTSNFTYDPTNRLSRSSTIAGVTSTTQTYNANDQRTSDETFDPNGSTTNTGGNGYSFDAEAKLTEATLVSPTAENVSLAYDGDGNLVQKAANGVTTSYLIDTNNLSGYAQIVEAKTNGALTDVFNYGSTGIVSQGHVPTGTTVYFGKDGSNNTRYLTDSQTGNVTDTFDYTADGIRVNRTGSFPAMHQFQGEYLEPDLNLYWLRARWMNPQTGEFMTMDSYEGDQTDPASLHKYAFVDWDGGTNKNDPTGHDDNGINWSVDEQFINMAHTFSASVATVIGIIMGNDVTTQNTLASRAATLVGYFQEASLQTGVPMNVLGSLGWSESGWITSKIQHNNNGTTDYGIMQLNSATDGSNAVASPDKANILYGAQELANDKKTAEAAIARGYLRVNGVPKFTKGYVDTPNDVYFLAVWLYKGIDSQGQGYANANDWFDTYYLSWPNSQGVPPSVRTAWGTQ